MGKQTIIMSWLLYDDILTIKTYDAIGFATRILGHTFIDAIIATADIDNGQFHMSLVDRKSNTRFNSMPLIRGNLVQLLNSSN